MVWYTRPQDTFAPFVRIRSIDIPARIICNGEYYPERLYKAQSLTMAGRHVKTHHTDKKKDDPVLKDVLAQRPEGGFRGRRRRHGS